MNIQLKNVKMKESTASAIRFSTGELSISKEKSKKKNNAKENKERIEHIRNEQEESKKCKKCNNKKDKQLAESKSKSKKKEKRISDSINLSPSPKKNDISEKEDHKNTNVKAKRSTLKLKSLPKNVNEYKHLLKSNLIVGSDIEWVLDLREKNKINLEELKSKASEPPKFYAVDSEKYIEKMKREEVEKMSNTMNCFNKIKFNESQYFKERSNKNTVDHLLRKRPDSVTDKNIIEFESSLRDYRKKINDKEKQWVDVSDRPKSYFLFSNKFPVVTKEGQKLFNETNGFSVKPVDFKLSKTNYNDRAIFRRTMTYDKTATGPFLGEHNSFIPNPKDLKNQKYMGTNIQEIRHLLSQKGTLQSNLLWEIGLRNNLMNKEDYLNRKVYNQEKKIKSKGKKNEIIADKENEKREWNNIFTKYPQKPKVIEHFKIKPCVAHKT